VGSNPTGGRERGLGWGSGGVRERSRRRALYLPPPPTPNTQRARPPRGFEPTITAGERQGRSPAENVGSNPTEVWIFVCCECRLLSGRGLCDELITHPEESYRLCCVVVCDLETSRIGTPYIYDISRLRVNWTNILKGNLL
jgi:hypothetical protein